MPRFDTMFQADVAGALSLRLLPLLLSLVMVDFFDTIGTVTAIAEAAEIGTAPLDVWPLSATPDRRSGIPRLRAILAIDAISASIGGLFGASSVTSYIESASGIAEGARTGLHTVCVGILFLLAMFAVPVVAIVPAAATAPALIIVGFLMCGQIVKIDFAKLETAIPAFLILLLIPLTYSISHGIGIGFVAYVAIQVLAGRARDVHPLMYATALAFVAFFIWGDRAGAQCVSSSSSTRLDQRRWDRLRQAVDESLQFAKRVEHVVVAVVRVASARIRQDEHGRAREQHGLQSNSRRARRIAAFL